MNKLVPPERVKSYEWVLLIFEYEDTPFNRHARATGERYELRNAGFEELTREAIAKERDEFFSEICEARGIDPEVIKDKPDYGILGLSLRGYIPCGYGNDGADMVNGLESLVNILYEYEDDFEEVSFEYTYLTVQLILNHKNFVAWTQ